MTPRRSRALDLTDDDVRAVVTQRMAGLYAGRPVIVAFGVLAGATPVVRWLRTIGCRVLVVCTTRGAGEVPGDDEAAWVEITAPAAGSATEELRTHDRLYRNLPAAAIEAVEAFDPEREGIWIVTPFVTTDEPILGRPVTSGRPAAFLALEDKLLAEEIWRAADVAAAPHRVVPVDRRALATATAEVASPLGAVWSGDNAQGFNGGGDFVRWVVDDPGHASQAAAFGFFAPRCDLVRVMPFLEGVPCSIHGIVLPDGTAAFRPVEIAVVRDPMHRRLLYSGLATTWDPPDADRAEMRAAVHRVGEHLRSAYGYRGAFGIDGVLTADGFRPTELNTRMSAGLTAVSEVDRPFFSLLQTTLVLGHDPGISVAELEGLLTLVDAHRTGKPTVLVDGLEVGDAHELAVEWDGLVLRRTDDPAAHHVAVAGTPSGGFAKVEPGDLLGPGDRLAHLAVALLRLLDETYDAQLGDYEAAPDVRRGADSGDIVERPA